MSHFISLRTGIDMTTLYRAEKENVLEPDMRNKNTLVKCETFDRAAFDALLAQSGCTGIRVYYGMEDGLKVRSLFVGVNADNEDMLPSDPDIISIDDNSIVEVGTTCPDFCPPPSPLNED